MEVVAKILAIPAKCVLMAIESAVRRLLFESCCGTKAVFSLVRKRRHFGCRPELGF
jgi:hypothetical protein